MGRLEVPAATGEVEGLQQCLVHFEEFSPTIEVLYVSKTHSIRNMYTERCALY